MNAKPPLRGLQAAFLALFDDAAPGPENSISGNSLTPKHACVSIAVARTATTAHFLWNQTNATV